MLMAASVYSSPYFKYDVFLNFRGVDTRHRFVGYLYHFLRKQGIRAFIDSESLQRGQRLTQAILLAIRDSRTAIAVLSENYASSSFCLDELVHILDDIKGEDRLVLPVFYYVDPSDVRHHRGVWGAELDKHEKRFESNKHGLQEWKRASHGAPELAGTSTNQGLPCGKELAKGEKRFKNDMYRLARWKRALQDTTEIAGMHMKNGECEVTYIRGIIKEVLRKINRAPLCVESVDVVHRFRRLVPNDRRMDWDPMNEECQQVACPHKRCVSDNPNRGSNCCANCCAIITSICSSFSSVAS